MSLNIHLYPSPIANETRMMKIARTLIEFRHFDNIELVGVQRDQLAKTEQVSEQIKVVRLKRIFGCPQDSSLKKIIGLIIWYFNTFFYLLTRKIKCLNAHSLSVLPLCIMVKWLKGGVVIYDTHEYETETTSASGFRKKISKKIESFFIHYCDITIVVSPSIKKAYEHDYKIEDVEVVLNTPVYIDHNQHYDIFRDCFSIEQDENIYLYQGGLFKNRSVENILDAFTKANSSNHIVFLGYGELEELVKSYSQKHSNIHFHAAVPPDELYKYTASADIGFCVIENSCLSYYYSLPNKLFEYLHAGIGVIGSDFPEISRILSQVENGHVLRQQTSQEILKVINLSIKPKKAVNQDIVRKYSWQNQQRIINQVYQQLF